MGGGASCSAGASRTLQDQRPLAQGGMPCLLAPSFCTTPSPPSAGCLPWGLPTRPHARGTVSSKIQCSGSREEADGVRWGQLLLQIPQGCWAWSCHDCAGALRLVRDTRPSDRPATTTRTMTTLGRYLVTSLEIYRRHPRDGVIAIVPMRKLSLRSDHLLVAPQPDSRQLPGLQSRLSLSFRGALECQAHVPAPRRHPAVPPS